MNKQLIAAIVSITLLSACEHKEPAAAVSKGFVISDTMMHMIQMDTVRTCDMSGELSLSGQVSFNENNVVKIFPRSSGQVTGCRVSLGDKVTKGQVLATIKSADIAGSYSDLRSAKADVAIAKRQMDNAAELYKGGISSEKEYNEAKQNYEKAEAAENKIQSAISINGGTKTTSGGEYLLTSPIDGYIVEKKVNAGSFIRQDMGDNLFTISDLKSVWIYANVYEIDIRNIAQGNTAKVIPMAYPDKVYSGKIDQVSQVLDPQSKALKVRVSLDNKDMVLKPEMFTKVIVSSQEGHQATCLPASAVISQDGKNYVVVYGSPEHVKIAEVEVIKTVGDKTYVRSGVDAGQVVITKHQLFIFNQLTNE
jgi:cobalt-zinc-cadmium efflux system membrane fusion protein